MPSDDSSVRARPPHLHRLRGPRYVPGRFDLYEVYVSAAAFAERLQTQPVHDFIASVRALSTVQPGSLLQLDEITVG